MDAVLASSHDSIKMITKIYNNHPEEPFEDEMNGSPIAKDIKKEPSQD